MISVGKTESFSTEGEWLRDSPQRLSLHAACAQARAVQQALHKVLHFGVKWLLVAGSGG